MCLDEHLKVAFPFSVVSSLVLFGAQCEVFHSVWWYAYKVYLSTVNSGIMVGEMMKGAVFAVGNVVSKSVYLELCTDIGGTVS